MVGELNIPSIASMENYNQTTVAIADDESLFRKGLIHVLNDMSNIKVTIEAGNGQELIDKLDYGNQLPDVLLLDMKMPIMDGISTTKILQKKYPSINIIILSTHFKKSFILNMIELGAASYLPKDTDPEELEKTIKEVDRNGFYYNQQVLDYIRENMIKPRLGNRQFNLSITSRETDVLELICNQYTTNEIAETLFISPRTVEGHRKNMLAKLDCKNTAGLVVYALENNLVKIKPQ